jgi:hypothetical protein
MEPIGLSIKNAFIHNVKVNSKMKTSEKIMIPTPRDIKRE